MPLKINFLPERKTPPAPVTLTAGLPEGLLGLIASLRTYRTETVMRGEGYVVFEADERVLTRMQDSEVASSMHRDSNRHALLLDIDYAARLVHRWTQPPVPGRARRHDPPSAPPRSQSPGPRRCRGEGMGQVQHPRWRHVPASAVVQEVREFCDEVIEVEVDGVPDDARCREDIVDGVHRTDTHRAIIFWGSPS